MPGRAFSTHSQNPHAIDALHDGIPEWMQSSIDAWLHSQLALNASRNVNFANIDRIHKLERLLRTSLSSSSDGGYEAMHRIFSRMNENEDLKLDVVDGLLQSEGNALMAAELETILLQSGSKWKVVLEEKPERVFSLQERVQTEVTQTMQDLVDHGGNTAQYITQAWNEIFGRSPNPSNAYSSIIKAIEAVSWQIVTPTNSRSTLGTIIRELFDHPEKFTVAITQKEENIGIESIRRQMSLIWDGQTDRHGTSDPVSPSQEAAEQAVFIGLSLCQQFVRGLVFRV